MVVGREKLSQINPHHWGGGERPVYRSLPFIRRARGMVLFHKNEKNKSSNELSKRSTDSYRSLYRSDHGCVWYVHCLCNRSHQSVASVCSSDWSTVLCVAATSSASDTSSTARSPSSTPRGSGDSIASSASSSTTSSDCGSTSSATRNPNPGVYAHRESDLGSLRWRLHDPFVDFF